MLCSCHLLVLHVTFNFLENQKLMIHAAYFIKCFLLGVFLYLLGNKQIHLFSTERRKKNFIWSYSCYLEICSKSLRVEYVIEKVMLTSGKGDHLSAQSF